MTLEFDHEVVIVNGFPIMGTVTVEAEGERDRNDGLWSLNLTCTGFEPYTPLGLAWSDLRTPCDTWLAANKARVEREALK